MKYLILIVYVFTVKCHALVIDLASDYDTSISYGPTDVAMTLLIKVQNKLDGKLIFNHIAASRIREWRELDSHPSTCLYNKAKTPQRERQAIYGKYPLMAFPANRLIINGGLSLPQTISIEDVISKYGLQLGIAKGRSYGEGVDNILAQKKHHIFSNEGANSSIRLRKMLLQGKVDAIIEYAPVFQNEYPSESQSGEITFHKIAGAKEVTFGYIVCADSEIGHQAIKLFDDAMRDPKLQSDIVKSHEGLFFEQESAIIRQALLDEFLVQE
ncbi:hypothetical protein PSECIP111951_02617 [Pseudoalteromonas holothuriae]|uniref:Uncharacterized protein n=1 Tax=Pseudoalteromonas holothuriae TaxID=2963714 RepID=A0A9W4R487_9GAMM|nr:MULTISPECIES: ABC transporter substrate-binding protein [unclassified Pseudoalteromonas]CAH9062068.1 hypothetical protein PSECIP111951_02617 [Pseudoalteromonas sp. CIP111951]CAH9065809.1 hypothetical protein PSECIP111854_03758 [Pseudoalteromonas sp. CIP111854]